MNFVTATDAAILLGVLTSIVIPFAHAWMKANILPDWVKLVVALIICVVGGYLTAVVGNKFVDTQSVIQRASVIGAAGASVYVMFFRGLGLEKVILPRAAVISEAQKSVAAQIGMMSTETIKDAVDPTCNTAIRVSADPIRHVDPQDTPVLPKG